MSPNADPAGSPEKHAAVRDEMVRATIGGKGIALFAVASLALLVVLGAMVDLSRLASARSELQQRLDAALSAGARARDDIRAETAEVAFDRMPTGSIARPDGWHFVERGESLSGTVSAAVPTTLSSMIGIRSVRITASGTTVRPKRCADERIRARDAAGCHVTVLSSTRTVPQH
ncbi:Tad domain-containing protein [Kaistia geumhonensis]|uniref:Membrane protein n=1 Tax=Kaistia geumhonensis TaxID=410839 RepID=A0ABU0M3H3_9HYPH|nr:Tad domain-containing protein [Kaistia geumhonensis]MCX5479267.1 Tad domain-containing protein [Kaistia geumhonensis]MDQ0515512.1 putative membrane protein [Kaistia geumhonensis]